MVELNGYTRDDVSKALKKMIEENEIEKINKNDENIIKYNDKVFQIAFKYDNCTIIKELYNLNESEIKELLEKTINNK